MCKKTYLEIGIKIIMDKSVAILNLISIVKEQFGEMVKAFDDGSVDWYAINFLSTNNNKRLIYVKIWKDRESEYHYDLEIDLESQDMGVCGIDDLLTKIKEHLLKE